MIFVAPKDSQTGNTKLDLRRVGSHTQYKETI